MADRQSLLTPLGVVLVESGSDKTKARDERLWLDCADVDLSHSEANLVQLAEVRLAIDTELPVVEIVECVISYVGENAEMAS